MSFDKFQKLSQHSYVQIRCVCVMLRLLAYDSLLDCNEKLLQALVVLLLIALLGEVHIDFPSKQGTQIACVKGRSRTAFLIEQAKQRVRISPLGGHSGMWLSLIGMISFFLSVASRNSLVQLTLLT